MQQMSQACVSKCARRLISYAWQVMILESCREKCCHPFSPSVFAGLNLEVFSLSHSPRLAARICHLALHDLHQVPAQSSTPMATMIALTWKIGRMGWLGLLLSKGLMFEPSAPWATQG